MQRNLIFVTIDSFSQIQPFQSKPGAKNESFWPSTPISVTAATRASISLSSSTSNPSSPNFPFELSYSATGYFFLAIALNRVSLPLKAIGLPQNDDVPEDAAEAAVAVDDEDDDDTVSQRYGTLSLMND